MTLMAFPPPEIVRRPDGVMLHGWCRCAETTSCQLIVVRLAGGHVALNFHGTAEHSITLTKPQQEALLAVMNQVSE